MGRETRRSGLSFLQYSVIAAVLISTLVTQEAHTASGSSRKVRVTVYFETRCSDSHRFFRDQLKPTYSLLKDILELEFVPFGKAVARPIRDGNRVKVLFKCQFGPMECLGNSIMSCAQSSLAPNEQYQLFTCMMETGNPVSAGPKCSETIGLNWSTLVSCSSKLGPELLYINGRKTAAIRPRLSFVPTITINGAYDNNSNQESLKSLLTQVCRAYGAPHPNCRE